MLAAIYGESSATTLRSGNAVSSLSIERRLDTSTGPIITNYGSVTNTIGSAEGIAGLSMDTSNNLYVADVINNKILKIDGVSGVLTTIAGLGFSGSSGDGKAAATALLKSPNAVSMDNNNVMYISDAGNNRVRMIPLSTTTRIIYAFAGSGSAGTTGDSGPATSAKLSPYSLAVDSTGNVYIGDIIAHRIRKVTKESGIITTVQYNTADYAGVVTYSVYVSYPAAMDVDVSGNIFIADRLNNVVRSISGSTGRDSIVAGVVGSGGNTRDGRAGESGRGCGWESEGGEGVGEWRGE